uniref:Uncharacterized protein n=1 Tax=Clytia hemisphaerica TaxID=252671 RepID=A0A7M5X851_9CNID
MNRITFFLFFLATNLCYKEVSSLKCYTCSTLDAEVCRLEQALDESQLECGARTTCVTMTYEQFSSGQKIKRFIKKCGMADSRRCKDNCENVEHLVKDSCKTSCCSTNLCNEEVNEKYIWYAFNTGKSRSNSANTKHMKNDLVTFCLTSV